MEAHAVLVIQSIRNDAETQTPDYIKFVSFQARSIPMRH